MKEIGNGCQIASYLINFPFLPPKGKPWVIREICVISPWPAFNKLIWTMYCSLFKLKTQSHEDYKIFPEGHAMTCGSFLSLMWYLQCGSQAWGTWYTTEGPLAVLRPGGLRVTLLPFRSGVHHLPFVVSMCCYVVRRLNGSDSQSFSKWKNGLIVKQLLSTVLIHPGHWNF